ncbi:hypothetical protein [Micromonospora sp. A200]|uniref:hypothetical protein n=1 Tax=Micromonospora sp. A200 TaxID=2940568 RepID=UPI002475ED8A|nr:hypothetical protein [Micromonospora sp. A200]
MIDPDGNAVLFGQRRAVPAQARVAQPGAEARFSLVREAAEAVGRRGGAPARCQVGGAQGETCGEPAEVKLADSWGDAVWGCMAHAEEALLNAGGLSWPLRGLGLGPFLRLGRRSRTGPPRAEVASYGDLPCEQKLPHYNTQNSLPGRCTPQCYDHNPRFLRFVDESGLPFRPHPDFTRSDMVRNQTSRRTTLSPTASQPSVINFAFTSFARSQSGPPMTMPSPRPLLPGEAR